MEAGAPRKLRVRCGTPIYSAPELVKGHEYLGPPVDMWAYGAVVYEMLHGKVRGLASLALPLLAWAGLGWPGPGWAGLAWPGLGWPGLA